MNKLTYTSVCRNNGLIIFDAVPPGELQTGRRLHSDVSDYTLSIGRGGYCTRYEVSSVASLHATMMVVLLECRAGVLKPILHFEGHGHPEKGMYLPATQEHISWTELQRLVAQINKTTRHNTGVVVAACHGFSLSNGLSVNSPSPFNFLVAPSVEMAAGVFQDTMSRFYKTIACSGDLQSGFAAFPDEMQMLVAGEWFYSSLGTYLIHHHTQKDRQEIVEEAVSRQMDRQPAANRAQRRAQLKLVRQSVKKRVNDSDNIARHFARIFFHDHPPVEQQEFQAFVDSGKERRR